MGKKLVYVETSALEGWGIKMSSINSNAVTGLNSFISTVGDLENSWVGNSATAFLTNTDKLVNDSLKQHDEMKNIEKFLNVVVETMKNQ